MIDGFISRPMLEIKLIDGSIEGQLSRFFRVIKNSGSDKYFHPHPFNEEEARKRSVYRGKDLYYVLSEGEEIIGYGMLRGWDEGYEVPSLGIIVHPDLRGEGMGKMFVHFLHAAAKRKGAKQVRIKVRLDNTEAVNLYKNIGYVLEGEEEGQTVGVYRL